MATNYNYSNAVSDIIKYKKWWDEANAAGDETAKNNHANSAAPAYEWLRNNGYGDAANTLQASNYTDAKKWATNGKTQTRPYLYSLGQKYGLSNSDVDKIISYDNPTRNISIGGKNIGNANLVVDGVSYWDDTSALDKGFADYISRSGTTVNTGVDNPAYNQSMKGATDKNNVLAGYIDSDRKDVQGKYNNIYDYANQDITKTDEYKSTYNSIMGKYDLSALQGRDNAAASGAASNGGNIDSYAAANAMRQQAALTATGQQIAHQAGLDAYNARVSKVANILNNLGVYNSGTYDAMNQTIANDANIGQQYFDNAETAKNNETARQQVYSDISGTVGDKVTKWLNSNIWNDDGSLVNYGQDFQSQIDTLWDEYQKTTDPAERARIWNQLGVLEAARNQKIDEQGLTYGKTYKYQSPTPTQASKEFTDTMAYNNKALETNSADTRYGIDSQERQNKYGIDANERMNKDNNSTQERMNKDNNSTQERMNTANIQSKKDEEKEDVYSIEPIDMTRIEQFNVDEYGQNAIKSVIDLANTKEKAGVLTKEEIVNELVKKSADNHTNKNQLEKVSKYLGIGVDWLEDVADVNPDDWTQGVMWNYVK